MSEFTQGPWRVIRAGKFRYHLVSDASDDLFVEVLGAPHTARSNADLIAAAPDLFAALQMATQFMDGEPLAQVQNILARARRGRQ